MVATGTIRERETKLSYPLESGKYGICDSRYLPSTANGVILFFSDAPGIDSSGNHYRRYRVQHGCYVVLIFLVSFFPRRHLLPLPISFPMWILHTVLPYALAYMVFSLDGHSPCLIQECRPNEWEIMAQPSGRSATSVGFPITATCADRPMPGELGTGIAELCAKVKQGLRLLVL